MPYNIEVALTSFTCADEHITGAEDLYMRLHKTESGPLYLLRVQPTHKRTELMVFYEGDIVMTKNQLTDLFILLQKALL